MVAGVAVIVALGLLAYIVVGGRTGSGDQQTTKATGSTGSSVPDGKHQITGTFTLIDSGIAGSGSSCSGTGGFSDFGPGMDVTVTDGEGKIIGVARTHSSHSSSYDEYSSIKCVVEFEVAVDDADFYQLEVGHRGKQSYSKNDLETTNWKVDLSLG